MFTVKSDQIIDSILVQTTQSSSNILPKWILSSYPQRTHTPRTPREKRTDINIYLISHTHTQNKSSSEIACVVLRLHCQLKVVPVPEGKSWGRLSATLATQKKSEEAIQSCTSTTQARKMCLSPLHLFSRLET